MNNEPLTLPPIGALVRTTSFFAGEEDNGREGEVVGFGTMTQDGDAWPVVLVCFDEFNAGGGTEIWYPAFLEFDY
jgi:hypothetical protein